MAGLVAAGADREAMGETYRQNLATAAAMAAKAKINVLIEPINTRDIPGFFLNRTEEAAAIIADVGAPTAALKY